ncbi:hypothetical protein MP228_011577 [Amoeboaphelidium protococcarum]|nr:hypothetical protein MP228_011577 [Amoeboaphelidium protococcarum]
MASNGNGNSGTPPPQYSSEQKLYPNVDNNVAYSNPSSSNHNQPSAPSHAHLNSPQQYGTYNNNNHHPVNGGQNSQQSNQGALIQIPPAAAAHPNNNQHQNYNNNNNQPIVTNNKQQEDDAYSLNFWMLHLAGLFISVRVVLLHALLSASLLLPRLHGHSS